MAEQNNQESIKTNNKKPNKHLARKIAVITFLALDVIALPMYFISIAVNDYGHIKLFSFGEKQENTSYPTYSSQEPEWVSNAKRYENKMLSHINHELAKRGNGQCYTIAAISYVETGDHIYDFKIAGVSDNKLYTLVINTITANDIQSYMLDLTNSRLDDYGFTISYTTIINSHNDGKTVLYVSEGPDEKTLVTGFEYDDNMYFVYFEHECAHGAVISGEVPEQVFRNSGYIQDFYTFVRTYRG